MELFIPDIGTILELDDNLEFTLYAEYRNTLLNKLNLPYENKIVVLPKGLLLKVDRIYIRKGTSQFSSITFTIPTMKLKADKLKYPKNVELGGAKFWIKLHEINGASFNLLESNKETIDAVRELYTEMEKECIEGVTKISNTTQLLKLFNLYLGSGKNLNNFSTSDNIDKFLNDMLKRMEKNNEKHITYFNDKFKKFTRDKKLSSILEN